MADTNDGKCVCGDYQAVHIMSRCWGPKCADAIKSKGPAAVCTWFTALQPISEIEMLLPFEPKPESHKSLIDEMFESARAAALKNPCICFIKPSPDCPNPLHRANAGEGR